jgi:K+-transporting ATPase ATPase C chain
MLRRQIIPALVFTALASVVLGLVYPLVIYGIGQLGFRHQADGSLITRNGQVVASSLLGQRFSNAAGKPLPQYFQPRPSAAGTGYDGTESGAANLGPSDPRLIAQCLPVQVTGRDGRPELGRHGKPVYEHTSGGSLVCDPDTVPQLAKAYREFNGLAPGTPVPVDAVTSSGSGLDPDISVDNADLQAPRVARTRHLPLAVVMRLVRANTAGRTLDFLGEVRVNVVELNLALERLSQR